ncbi:MAG: hypothetical protein JW864_11595 [Spirochaetes bacterium]|nr:hypothetical protein [Spirochaetota bacterium]
MKSKWLFNVVRFTKNIENGRDLIKILDQHFKSGCESDKPCPFKSGRPVICGRYFCKDITSNLKSDFVRFLLFQLADIIPTFLDVKIDKKKIINLDFYNESFKISDKDSQTIKNNLNLALRKFNTIKKYMISPSEIVNKNELIKDILFLEKHSGLSILETISD